MRKYRLLWNILKRTNALGLIGGYLVILLIASILILIFEPNITTFGDSLWYCFAVLTTIGFGDFCAVTLAGRITSVVLSVYSILIIAIIPGIITSYYLEALKIKRNESTEKFLNDLEHLPELSKEELADISEKVKNFQKNKNRN